MRYIILIYGNSKLWKLLSESDIKELKNTHARIQKELRETAELLDHKELVLESSKVIRTINGVTSIAEGPFSEGKQTIAGYYLVKCNSEKRVLEIAAQFKETDFSPVEIRRLNSSSSWD